MTDASKSLLGKETDYSQAYSPDLLFPLDRSLNRSNLPFTGTLPFHGEDVWTAYEISWLDKSGKPHVAIATFHIPAESAFMVESKSFKLYLNAYNYEQLDSRQALIERVQADLSKATGAEVRVSLQAVDQCLSGEELKSYESIDLIETSGFEYQPNPELLKVHQGRHVTENLCSNLLRSNCPVTGQPDWASVYIHYTGPQINKESLLKYIVSFRECQDFHEHCVETMFCDLKAQCGCESLSVYARYTRRGGLDINPYRATLDLPQEAPIFRTPRQ